MVEKKKNEIVKAKNALEHLAERLQVNADSLKKTLKATVIKDMKMKNGKTRTITDEEFISFIIVANAYKLNPLLKEIYAYPDTKGGGIIPVVATDGWNKLMTTHPSYKTHYYVVSDDMVDIKGAKPCPAWMEIHIEKKDDSKVIVREYLDECFNGGKSFPTPWDSHTKRMLRHKTKIQGAREAFGFGGIYDKDEAERISEAPVIEAEAISMKPEVELPEKIDTATDEGIPEGCFSEENENNTES